MFFISLWYTAARHPWNEAHGGVDKRGRSLLSWHLPNTFPHVTIVAVEVWAVQVSWPWRRELPFRPFRASPQNNPMSFSVGCTKDFTWLPCFLSTLIPRAKEDSWPSDPDMQNRLGQVEDPLEEKLVPWKGLCPKGEVSGSLRASQQCPYCLLLLLLLGGDRSLPNIHRAAEGSAEPNPFISCYCY